MARHLPPAGTYLARRTGPLIVDAPESGSLLVWISYILVHPEWGAFQGKHMVCIGTKDGTLQTRALETFKKIWPDFDMSDPFSLEQIPVNEENQEAEFELADCYVDDTYTPTGKTEPVLQFKAQWLNPIGGTLAMPDPLADDDKKKVRAKWGSKFKANAGATAKTPAKPATAAAKPTQQDLLKAAPKAAVGGPPSRRAAAPASRTMTQEEVWTAFYNARGGTEETQDALGEEFYAAQDEIAPGKNGELNPQQWGEVATKLGV